MDAGRGPFSLAKGTSGTLTLNTLVAPDAPPASLHNVTDLTADSLPAALERTADVAVTSATLLRGTKFVKGDRDAAFIPGPGVGNTTRGGTAQYQATIRNVSDVAVTNVIVVDTLPIPGDIGLKDPAPSLSGWQPFFAGEFTANPPAATVQYTTSHNPCRLDLSVNPPGCDTPNWGPLPADLSSVGAIRVDFGSGVVLDPNDVHHVQLDDGRAGGRAAELDRLELVRLHRHPDRQRLAAGVGRAAEGRSPGHRPNQPPCTTPPCTPPPPPPPLPPTGADANVMAIVAVS